VLRLPIKFHSERISLGICPGQIGIVRRKSGVLGRRQSRRLPPEQFVINVPDTMTVPGWKPAVDMIKQWINEYAIHDVSAILTVSNQLARFALVPWSAHVVSAAELAALARARFETQYGDMAEWTIRLDPGQYGAARVACAMETEFLDSLRSLLDSKRITCSALQPYFIARWNRLEHKHWPPVKSDVVFAVAESQTVTMATIKSGQWQSVRTVRDHADARSLQVLLERETLLQGLVDTPSIRIDAPALRASDSAMWPDYMRLIESDSDEMETALAIALAGDRR
jgi:hypothetical protein